MAMAEIVGLDRTASEVMAIMSRSSSQSQSQQAAPGGGVLLTASGAGPAAGKVAPTGQAGARFSVFGKNLTNIAAAAAPTADQQQVRLYAR